MDSDDIDIYGDLGDFDENIGDDRCPKELRERIKDLENTVTSLENQIRELQATKAILEVNLSSLIKTAKNEISRKDRMIAELRQERENSIFRRTAGPRAHPGARNVANSSSRASNNLNKVSNKPANVIVQRQTEITQSYTAANPSKVEIDKDDDEDASPTDPTLPSTTIFGQRLQKKLQEEAESEKKNYLQSQVPTNQQNPELHESERHKNRDNKENQRDLNPPNPKSSEIPSDKILKRPKTDDFDRNSEKRRKIGDDGENKSQKIETSQKYQSMAYDSMYFCSSETREDDRDHIERSKKRQSRESSPRSSTERKNTHRRNDNYPVRKNSPVRHSSRDYDNRNRKPDRNYKNSRQPHSEHSRASDLRDRIAGSKNRSKDSPNDRRFDEKHRDFKNDRKNYETHRTSSRSKKNKINENDRRNTRSRSRDRSHTRGIESSGKKSSNSTSSRSHSKSVEIQKIVELKTEVSEAASDEAMKNRREKDENKMAVKKATKIEILEEGEILEDSTSDNLDKNSLKNTEIKEINCNFSAPILENYLRSTSSQVNSPNIDTQLLETLNTDTVMRESKFCRQSTSLTPGKEEKIENIEAFIRSFDPEKCKHLDSARLLNTTIDIAKSLEYEAEDKGKYLNIESEININNEEAFNTAADSEITGLNVDALACHEAKHEDTRINEKSSEEYIETDWNFQDSEIGATVEISTIPGSEDGKDEMKISEDIALTLVDNNLNEKPEIYSPSTISLHGKNDLKSENIKFDIEKIGLSTRQTVKDSNIIISSEKIILSDDNSNDKLKMDSVIKNDMILEANLIIDEASQSKPDIPKSFRKTRKVTTNKLINADNNEKQQKEKKNVKKSQQNIPQKNEIKVIRRKKFRQLTDDSSSVTLVVSERKNDDA